jgi:hypothetical protein
LFVAVLSSQNSNDFDLLALSFGSAIYDHDDIHCTLLFRSFFLLFRLGDFFQFLCLVAFDFAFAFASFPTSLLFCLFAFPLLCFFCSFPAFTLVCFLLFRFYLSSPKATPKISESIRPKPTQNKLDTSLE